MWEPVALCCFTRKTGCLVLGSLEVIGAIIALVWGAISLGLAEGTMFAMICKGMNQTEYEGPCTQLLRTIVDSVIAIMMVCALVQIVCSSMLIHGVRTNNHCLITPYLIKNAIHVGFNIVVCCVVVAFLCVVSFPAMVFVAYSYGALIFMWTYFLLTVRAYYYEVKLGKADDHHKLVEHSQL